MKTNISERRIRFRAPPCGLQDKKNESINEECKCLLTFTHLPNKIYVYNIVLKQPFGKAVKYIPKTVMRPFEYIPLVLCELSF